jgi:hypothetical protein
MDLYLLIARSWMTNHIYQFLYIGHVSQSELEALQR